MPLPTTRMADLGHRESNHDVRTRTHVDMWLYELQGSHYRVNAEKPKVSDDDRVRLFILFFVEVRVRVDSDLRQA